MLAEAAYKDVKGTVISIAVPNDFAVEGIKRNQEIIEAAAERVFGRKLALQISVGEIPAASASEPVNEEVVVTEELEDNSSKELFEVKDDLTSPKKELPHGMDKILEKFPGKIVKKIQAKRDEII